MTNQSSRAVFGTASIQGSREFGCDAAAGYWLAGTDVTAVAVVDGMGSTAAVAEVAPLLARVAVRVGARKTALPGILAATEMLADPTVELPEPDAVLVLAVSRPGEPVVIAHVGDCRAYGWDGSELRRLTVDHTKGERLRHDGMSDEQARRYDQVPVTTVARATVGTISLRETFDQVIVLTSDGVHKVVPHERMARIVAEHATDLHMADPGACARALVDAVHAAGGRDDATAAVLCHPEPLRTPKSLEGR
jgi:protein phosphatase